MIYGFPAGVPVSILRRLPALLALLILGAHFLRFGYLPLVLLCLALLVPLFIAKSRAQAAVRWALVLGVVVWLWTLVQDVQTRLAFGEPWLRLVFILGAVAAFTGWAAWLLRSEQTREKPGQD
jgi:uncharacterized membrane protein YGL010W